ncbi:MAG: Omp28 family outer membrane lipoprotein [Bacteroidaceae bacterium]|nr:Omp28 family outer membrane lipoprotein [Bacteroidaceae bacterium]
MNFKKYLTMGFMAAALVACDNVDEDERFIPVGGTPTAIQKNILIEDFTGMRCINCPNAADEIQALSNYYEGRIVSVAIHPKIGDFHGPLATELATTYAEHYGIESLPKGMVDRQAPEDFDKWSTTVYQRASAEVSSVNIVANTHFAELTRELTIDLNLTAEIEANADLQVWLTESNIISFQSMPNGSINANYTHNHVLRDAVNGTWGEAVELSNEATQLTYTYSVPEEWNAQHMAVVAFVSNDDGVLQVIEHELFEDAEPETPVAPKMELTWNGAVANSSISLQATDGVATLEDLLLTNAGGGTLAADIAVEVVENETNADIQFTLNGEALSQSASVSLTGAEVANIGSVATFAPNAYGTAKVQLTFTEGENTKTLVVNFVNEKSDDTPTGPFQLVYNGLPLADGETLNINAIVTDLTEFMPDYYIVEAKTNDDVNALNIKNLTGEVLSATVKVEVLSDVEGTSYSLCSFGMCSPVENGAGTKVGEIQANSEAATGWDVAFTHGMYGTAQTKLTVTAGGTTQTVYVNFVYENTEVPEPTGPFQLVYNGHPIADGETLDINAIVTDLTEFMPDYYIVEAKTNDDENALNIKNLTGEVLSATVNVEVLSNVEGTSYSLCSFGMCTPVENGAGTKVGEIQANSEAATGWDVAFTHGMYGTAQTKLTVTVGEESQTIYVNFNYQP